MKSPWIGHGAMVLSCIITVLVTQAPSANAQELLAPHIHGPLSPCNSDVVVEGALPGTLVSVYEDDNVLASGVMGSGWSITLHLPRQLHALSAITAKQSAGSRESQLSAIVVTQQSPTSLPVPTINQGALYSCARSIWIEGAQPGASIVVSQGSTIGQAPSIDGNAWINLTQAVSHASPISIRQTACGLTAATISPPPDIAPDPMPDPTIDRPLVSCQPSIIIRGVVNGAVVAVTKNGTPQTPWNVPVESFEYPMDIKETDVVTVSQSMPGCELPRKNKSPGLESATTGPATGIPTPALVTPICAEDHEVTIKNLTPGALVTLTVGGTDYQGVAYAATCAFGVPGLTYGKTVSVTQSYCNVPSPTATATVSYGAAAGFPPALLYPVYECATGLTVTGSTPGAMVHLESAAHGVISGYYKSTGADIDVSVAPALQVGDAVWPVEVFCGGLQIGGLPWPVLQRPALQAPNVASPLYAGQTSIIVTPQIGVFVDVLDSGGHILGSAYAGTLPIAVGLVRPLVRGETISVRARACNQESHVTKVGVDCPADATWNGRECVSCTTQNSPGASTGSLAIDYITDFAGATRIEGALETATQNRFCHKFTIDISNKIASGDFEYQFTQPDLLVGTWQIAVVNSNGTLTCQGIKVPGHWKFDTTSGNPCAH